MPGWNVRGIIEARVRALSEFEFREGADVSEVDLLEYTRKLKASSNLGGLPS